MQDRSTRSPLGASIMGGTGTRAGLGADEAPHCPTVSYLEGLDEGEER